MPSEGSKEKNHEDITSDTSSYETSVTEEDIVNQLNRKVTTDGSTSRNWRENEDSCQNIEMPSVRDDYRKKYGEMSNKEVYEQLEKVDPVSARKIHPNNRRKLER